MTGLVLTDEAVAPELKVVLEEQNQRVANNPRRAALRADRRRALSQPSLRQAGDRLAARDRKAQPRGRAGVLPALLHAQQRRPGGRRRRHRRRGQGASPRRPTARSPRSPRSARACGRRSRRRSRRGRSRWPIRASAAEPAARLSRAVVARPPSPANPRRSKCWRIILGHGTTSRLYRTLVVETRARGQRRRLVPRAPRSMPRSFGVYGSPKPGVTLPSSKTRIDAVIDDVVAKGVTAGRGRARQEPADRRRHLCAGQPGHAWRAGTAPR